jgi:hypothetical protein
VLLDYLVYPQEPENRGFRPLLIDKVLNAGPPAAWKAATYIEGVLITHAGVSETYQAVFHEECESDPERLATHLNQAFLSALRRELETGEYDERGILGDDGPTWFRPRPYSHLLPLAGIRQVVGHTPSIPELEKRGFHMIDPCAFLGMEGPGRFRYAVIEDCRVRLETGTLLGNREFSRHEDFASVLCA